MPDDDQEFTATSRDMPRLTTEEERRHLKTMTFMAVHSVGGGDAFEASTRVKQGVLSKYGSKSYPETFIPLDIAVELDRLGQSPVLIGACAKMLGYRLVPCGADDPLPLTLCDAKDVAKETSDVVNLLLVLLAGGKPLDEAGRRQIAKEVTEAKDKLNSILVKSMGG